MTTVMWKGRTSGWHADLAPRCWRTMQVATNVSRRSDRSWNLFQNGADFRLPNSRLTLWRCRPRLYEKGWRKAGVTHRIKK